MPNVPRPSLCATELQGSHRKLGALAASIARASTCCAATTRARLEFVNSVKTGEEVRIVPKCSGFGERQHNRMQTHQSGASAIDDCCIASSFCVHAAFGRLQVDVEAG
jgi:hypothetical protein